MSVSNKREKRFYVPEDSLQDLELFLKLLKREGKSLSAWFRENMRAYNQAHQEGNPQLRIDKFGELTRHRRKPSNCRFWHPRPKSRPYEAWCSKRRRLVVAASCCDLWKG